MNYRIYLFRISHLLLMIYVVSLVNGGAVTAQSPTVDFDGDGKSDVSVFRPSDRIWYIKKSSGGFLFLQWGLASDNLVPGDYTGDGKTDVAVHRKELAFPETGTWYILNSQDFTYTARRWASNNIGEFDIPVPADYDGDEKTDVAVFRPSDGIWYQQLSSSGFRAERFGLSTDIPIQNVYVR